MKYLEKLTLMITQVFCVLFCFSCTSNNQVIINEHTQNVKTPSLALIYIALTDESANLYKYSRKNNKSQVLEENLLYPNLIYSIMNNEIIYESNGILKFRKLYNLKEIRPRINLHIVPIIGELWEQRNATIRFDVISEDLYFLSDNPYSIIKYNAKTKEAMTLFDGSDIKRKTGFTLNKEGSLDIRVNPYDKRLIAVVIPSDSPFGVGSSGDARSAVFMVDTLSQEWKHISSGDYIEWIEFDKLLIMQHNPAPNDGKSHVKIYNVRGEELMSKTGYVSMCFTGNYICLIKRMYDEDQSKTIRKAEIWDKLLKTQQGVAFVLPNYIESFGRNIIGFEEN